MNIFLVTVASLFISAAGGLFFMPNAAHNNLFNHRQEFDPRIKSYTPEYFALKTESVQVQHKKNTIQGYLYSGENPNPNKLVVVCHGMWSSKEAYMQEIGWFATHGLLVLSYDYIGTNESSGKLGSFGNSLESTNAMLDFVKTRPDLAGREIYVVGHSWGGYAASNISAYHPEIKGVVAISPLLSTKAYFKYAENPYPAIVSSVFLFIDHLKGGEFAAADGVKNLETFARNGGKVLVIQSADDGVVPYKSSLGLLKNHFGLSEAENNVDGLNMNFITVQNRRHNPHYTDDAVALLDEFYAEYKNTKKEDLEALYARTDFFACGKLDDSLMQKMYDLIME